eukprot:4588564-Amphidinium_carterae.4
MRQLAPGIPVTQASQGNSSPIQILDERASGSRANTAHTQVQMMTKEQLHGNINETEMEQYDEWKDYNEETEEYYEEYNDEDVKYVVAMLNKGKMAKGNGKERTKVNKGKGKESQRQDSDVLHVWTAEAHISPNCPMKKGGKGNTGKKGPYNGQWYDGKGYGQPQSQ